MKAYKVELLILDFDELGLESVSDTIENVRYPNDCIAPSVMSIEGREIGEWSDDNPLNRRDLMQEEYQRLFGKHSTPSDSGREG
jgi:hypothetical protein